MKESSFLKEDPPQRNMFCIFAFCFNAIWGEENGIFQELNEILGFLLIPRYYHHCIHGHVSLHIKQSRGSSFTHAKRSKQKWTNLPFHTSVEFSFFLLYACNNNKHPYLTSFICLKYINPFKPQELCDIELIFIAQRRNLRHRIVKWIYASTHSK